MAPSIRLSRNSADLQSVELGSEVDAAEVEHLELKHNRLSDARSLSNLRSFVALKSLSLCGNSITSLRDLSCIPANLARLDLTRNRLESLVGFADLPCLGSLEYFSICKNRLGGALHDELKLAPLSNATLLRELDLSSTGLVSLDGLHGALPKLNVLHCTDNCISGRAEAIGVVGSLRLLTELSLGGNPVSLDPMYRHLCLKAAEQLVLLDGCRVPPVHAIRARRQFCDDHKDGIERQIALCSPPRVEKHSAECSRSVAVQSPSSVPPNSTPELPPRVPLPSPIRSEWATRQQSPSELGATGLARARSDSAFLCPDPSSRPHTAPLKASRLPNTYSLSFEASKTNARGRPTGRRLAPERRVLRPSTSGLLRRQAAATVSGVRGGPRAPQLTLFNGSAMLQHASDDRKRRPRRRQHTAGVRVVGSQKVYRPEQHAPINGSAAANGGDSRKNALPGRSLHAGHSKSSRARAAKFETLPLYAVHAKGTTAPFGPNVLGGTARIRPRVQHSPLDADEKHTSSSCYRGIVPPSTDSKALHHQVNGNGSAGHRTPCSVPASMAPKPVLPPRYGRRGKPGKKSYTYRG